MCRELKYGLFLHHSSSVWFPTALRCQHFQPLRRGGQNPAAAVAGRSDPASDVGDGGRHLGVGRISYVPAFDLDRAHAAETRGEATA